MIQNVELTCICCPMGCRLSIDHDDKTIIKLENNRCPRGCDYAENELFNPLRTLTTTIKIDSKIPLLPVKTRQAIPKHLMIEAVRELSVINFRGNVRVGDVICRDICGTGIDVIATRTI